MRYSFIIMTLFLALNCTALEWKWEEKSLKDCNKYEKELNIDLHCKHTGVIEKIIEAKDIQEAYTKLLKAKADSNIFAIKAYHEELLKKLPMQNYRLTRIIPPYNEKAYIDYKWTNMKRLEIAIEAEDCPAIYTIYFIDLGNGKVKILYDHDVC